jgi:hypothetical protein
LTGYDKPIFHIEYFSHLRKHTTNMLSIEQLKINLIEKIKDIQNRDIITSLDKLLELTVREKDICKVSKEQRFILNTSEEDIRYNKLIPDEDINREEDLWLSKQYWLG